MKRNTALVTATLLTALLCSCDDSSSSSSSSGTSSLAELQAAEGVYQLTAYTSNESACSEGPDILAEKNDKYVVMAASSYSWGGYTSNTLVYALCGSVDECAEMGAAIKSQGNYMASESASITSGNKTSGYSAQIIGTGYWQQDGTCTKGNLRTIALTFNGTSFDYTEEIQIADTFQQDAEGHCTTDESQKHLNPCSQMVIMQGTFVQALGQ